MKLILIFIVLFQSFISYSFANSLNFNTWNQKSDKHFIVYYKDQRCYEEAGGILNKAEYYYERIDDNIGYSRYQNFYTWDDRVPIVLFSSQEEYIKFTGRPIWSKGFSVSHLESVNKRIIVAYVDQDDFLDYTLPHEIGHLILHDFIGNRRNIPNWIDEGIAQLEEKKDSSDHLNILATVLKSGNGLSIKDLQTATLITDKDSRYASFFYAESLYIVDFLVKTYGKETMIKLFRNLRDGETFETAFARAYYPSLTSLQDLQEKWDQYLERI